MLLQLCFILLKFASQGGLILWRASKTTWSNKLSSSIDGHGGNAQGIYTYTLYNLSVWGRNSKETIRAFFCMQPSVREIKGVLFKAISAEVQGSQSARKIGPKPEFGSFAKNGPNNTRNLAFWPEKLKFSATLAEKVPIWPEFDPNFNLRLCEEKNIIHKQHFILL